MKTHDQNGLINKTKKGERMKNILAMVMVLVGFKAMANDSGMPYIEVDQLTFKRAEIGTSIEFRGKEAASLFKALPNMDVENSAHGFTATGQKKSVSIICMDKAWNDKENKFIAVSNGPICTVKVGPKFVRGEGDDSKWVNDREPQSVKDNKKSKK